MSDSCSERKILVSELIAGLLLINREYECLEVCKVFCDIAQDENIILEEPEHDFDQIAKCVVCDKQEIKIKDDYDYETIIRHKNKNITVYDFLLSKTSDAVLEYLKITNKKSKRLRRV